MSTPAEIRTVVVDDEPVARRGLRRLLEAEPRVEVVRECSGGAAAIEAIRELDPDLVLLDVQMPDMSGFDVVHAIGAENLPPAIFVTAFDKYAVSAFEANAVDYVLKPVDPERFAAALQRAFQAVGVRRTGNLRGRLESLLERIEAREQYPSRIVVREAGRVHFVPTGEIAWLEAAGNYVRLHTDGGILHQRETLASLEERLDPAEFLRIHRSTVVRLDRIREIAPVSRGDSRLVLTDGTPLTVSRRYRPVLDERLRGM